MTLRRSYNRATRFTQSHAPLIQPRSRQVEKDSAGQTRLDRLAAVASVSNDRERMVKVFFFVCLYLLYGARGVMITRDGEISLHCNFPKFFFFNGVVVKWLQAVDCSCSTN